MFYVLGVAQNIYISNYCFHFMIGIAMNVCTYCGLHFSLQMCRNSNWHHISAIFCQKSYYKNRFLNQTCKSLLFWHGNNKCDYWLFNPSCKVQPSLPILDKNSVYNFLTCSKHNNGSKLYVIYPPRNPMAHILPATTSDQLWHVVMQSCTIKPIKTTQYSTHFSMHK